MTLTRSARRYDEDSNDVWYMGGTTAFVCGIWNGHEYKEEIYDTNSAKKMYNGIIDWMEANYYDFLHSGSYVLSDNVVQLSYCRDSGLRPGPNCVHIANGWYSQNNIPRTCDGGSDHISRTSATATPSPSIEPSIEAEPVPERGAYGIADGGGHADLGPAPQRRPRRRSLPRNRRRSLPRNRR